VYQFRSLKTAEARQAFVDARADLGVLAYVTQIVPEPLLHIPRLTSICFHPSLLPRYRGGSAIAWQLIEGVTETGVTVFWPDAGIDTGPILLQRAAAVGPDDTAGSLYYKTLYPLGVQVVLDAVALVREGRATRAVQDESQASYQPLCRDEHAAIDWTRPAADVHNLIRGCDPQPGAHTTWQGARLRLYEPHRVDGTAPPGTVVAVGEGGITIAAAGGAIRCARARDGGTKAPAAEVARTLGLGPGTRLGA
jgi:methionyl-tRNA formyltransferase